MGSRRSAERNRGGPPAVGGTLAELARRQYGVVSASQLRALGLDRFAVRRRVLSGHLHRLHRGVYAVGHTCLEPRGIYLAAVLGCGPGAALSHRSAGALWDLRRSSTRVEVTVPRTRRGPEGLTVHSSRMLDSRDVTVVDGIAVTSLSRTLADLAAVVPRRELANALDRAERLQLLDLSRVDELLARSRGRRGAAALGAAIAAWRPRNTRSELEDRHLELVSAAGLQGPEVNVLLAGERERHEVDALWRGAALVVQLDGFAYHRTRRDRERDAAADADLELAGYRVLRLTWDDVTVRSASTARRLRRLLGASRNTMPR